ncbi:amidohydrolase family protein [Pseudohoeflea coraliihabitans]|uniref:Amidohydrolase n=1 Tax=Pseudohoeflea coraliihabitans TaxID=2860393 RepID=A0ABS6WJ46_9HYPH|nr:amidohydrolase [Pseudohoeflea sp. DP4N28-3]MBW3095961.1 amidohydrolase [Pseudohoeflea sp. DP4N28-3]
MSSREAEIILIRGADVLTMAAGEEIRPSRADVLIESGRITGLGADLAVPAGAEIVEAAGRLVMPGLVNAHLHSSEMFLRGRYERLPLEMWLCWSYPFFGLEPPDLELLRLRSLLVAMESLRSGVTMISDDFFDPPAHHLARLGTVFSAYDEAGIRANVSSGLMNRPYLDTLAYGREVFPARVQAQLDFPLTGADEYTTFCEAVFRTLHNSGDGRLRYMLAPSGPQRCTVELMQACRDLARQWQVPYHTHVLETRTQAVTADKLFGGSIVRYMHEHGLLNPNVLMAHAVWITDEDIALMADAGVSVSWNILANLKLGSGLAPVRRLLNAGINVALGTDGASSNDTLRLFDVLRAAALVSSATAKGPMAGLSSGEVLHAATLGGAQAAMLAETTGSLEVGKQADLIILDLSHGTAFTPLSDVVNQLVYCENGSSVESVMVDGCFVIRDGSFTRLDEAGILSEMRARMPAFLRQHQTTEAMNSFLIPLFQEVIARCDRVPVAAERYLPS